MPRGLVRPVGYEDVLQSEVQRALCNVLDFVHLHQMLGSDDKHEAQYARDELRVWELSPLEKQILGDFARFHVGADENWYGNPRELTIELRAENGNGAFVRHTGEALGFSSDPDTRQVKLVAISVDPEVIEARP